MRKCKSQETKQKTTKHFRLNNQFMDSRPSHEPPKPYYQKETY